MTSGIEWECLLWLWKRSSSITGLHFLFSNLCAGLFPLECEVAIDVRNERVKEPCRATGWNCRSQEGQAHRLLCSPVVKQWKSVANTALFPHDCSACRGGWKGLLGFTLFRNGLLEDTQLSRPEWKHTIHSTRGFQSQMQGPPGVCVAGQLFNFTLFSHAGGQHNERMH